jgi:hypothetical protein
MKILNATWYTEMGEPKSIGIVIAEVEGEEKAYIGRSRSINNLQYGELEDAQWIAQFGSECPLAAARVLMPVDTIWIPSD